MAMLRKASNYKIDTIDQWWKTREHLSLNVEMVLANLSDIESQAVLEFLEWGYSTVLDIG